MRGPFFKKSSKDDLRSNPILYNRPGHDNDSMLRKPTLFSKASQAVSGPLMELWRFLRRRTNLTFWIVVGVVVGILIGKFAPEFAVKIGPLGAVFIRLIQCVEGPLIFSTLVVGIAGHGDDLARIGRLALKSVVFFEIVTTLALILGLIAVNIVKPGEGSSMAGLHYDDANTTEISWVTEMNLIVPTSFFLALTDHTAVLAIVFCAIMFAVAITHLDEKSKGFLLDFNLSLSNAMFKIVDMIMNYAPIGVACSLASTVGEYGLDALESAGKLVGTLYITLIIFVLFVLVPIVLLMRFPLREFASAVLQPFLMAFATSSSESALPKAMENMVEFGVPLEIAAFVIPTGYSFNLDGSTLYLAIATIFCAQVAGIPKTPGEQIVIVLTLMLTSKGVAAVPRASYIVLASTLSSANIPWQPLGLILAVDAFMDMARSGVNVLGNMTACAVVAKWEGEFRNLSWRARMQSQQPETLVMDDMDRDLGGAGGYELSHRQGRQHGHTTSILPLHSGVVGHDMYGNPFDPAMGGNAGSGVGGGLHGRGGGGNTGFNAEKISIHSVQSVQSVDSIPEQQPQHAMNYNAGPSSSNYQQGAGYNNQFAGMINDRYV
ncbi:hypothetical protein EMPS_04304 [Entomortierella parvispora]|uniref:Amino acid transporter n=1 Tax=Entomortierella parvispora TaxID=205924 RepID=A0A9P3LVE2_9FUNG|nr:hypothetical protein EMPS_04304 [Entomortierella parvispora]